MPLIKAPTEGTAVPTAVSTEGVALIVTASSGNVLTAPTGPGFSTGQAKNLITGSMNITAGTGTTAVVIRCRQNGVAGTQVGLSKTVTLAAGNTDEIPFNFLDPAATSIQQYAITVQQTGGTAAGTVNDIIAWTPDYS